MNVRYAQTSKGFSAIELVIALAIVGVIGGAGAYIYVQRSGDSATGANDQASSSAASNDVPAAPTIQSASDLDNANKTLDQTNLDASDADTQELDQNLANL